jgi:hypothetical protein
MVDQPAVLYRSDTSADRQAYDAYQRDLCQAAANYVRPSHYLTCQAHDGRLTLMLWSLLRADHRALRLRDDDGPRDAGDGSQARLLHLTYRPRRSISPPILLAALVYLSRLKARHPPSTGASGARLFLTALVLGQKILQDGPFSNQTWVRLIRGHYSLLELACMERELLAFLAWDLSIEVDQLLAVEVRKTVAIANPDVYCD